MTLSLETCRWKTLLNGQRSSTRGVHILVGFKKGDKLDGTYISGHELIVGRCCTFPQPLPTRVRTFLCAALRNESNALSTLDPARLGDLKVDLCSGAHHAV